jgi:aspartate/methionine/tyrosine aminotransferase
MRRYGGAVERVRRLDEIPGFGIDRVAAAAGDDPEVLRMENLDTDVPPPAAAVEATRAAVGEDDANSWLPFNGREDLKAAVVELVKRRGDPGYEAVASVCTEHDLWLLYWAGFEAVRYDGREVLHPAALPGMRERTVIVGAPWMEQRMIAWRVGWVVMPSEVTDLVSRAQIYNGLVASGFAQVGTRTALEVGDDDVASATEEWQRRRDETLRRLDGLPVVPPHGAWAALLDAEALGLGPGELSARLLEHKVAATPMDGWGGEIAARTRHLRFVFSNEPVERLALLGERVRAALG